MAKDSYAYIEVQPGVIVDSDGVIVEGPSEPSDYLAVVAHRVAEWQEDAKALDMAIAAGKRALLRAQSDKRVAYGPVVATRMQSVTQVLDLEAFRADMAPEELSLAEWRELALAATGYDRALLTAPFLASRVQQHTHPKASVEFAKVSRATVAPPRILPMPRPDGDPSDLTDLLQASLEAAARRGVL